MRLGAPAHGIVTKNSTQNSARGWWGSRGWAAIGLQGVVVGLFDMKLTLSASHNCLKLKMII